MSRSLVVGRWDAAFKRPVLSRWILKGPPETWRSQLEEYNRKEPVFALVGGITKGTWRPIHEFSEENHIPCLLPVTDFPVISETDWYTLYFSKGLYQEGESTARFLASRNEPAPGASLVQVVRSSPEGLALSAGFHQAWQELGHAAPITLTLKEGELSNGEAVRAFMEREKPSVLVLWDGPAALQILQVLQDGKTRPKMVFLSSSYLKENMWQISDELRDVVYLSYPYRLPAGQAGKEESSFIGSNTAQGHELVISKKMFTAVKTMTQAILDMNGQYYRDNLLDVIGMNKGAMGMGMGGRSKSEEETYPLYERFSFGPGQRYASKGCFIVQLTKGPKPDFIRKSDWITY